MVTSVSKAVMLDAEDWLEPDGLELLECWARDNYSLGEIAEKMGISIAALGAMKKKYPEIQNALRKGKELIDYKVENALLKAALGYKTKEVKVTTIMRFGKVHETIKEVSEVERAPQVTAIQTWLYNKLPDKWKKDRNTSVSIEDEDTSIQVTVVRAGKGITESEETINESVALINSNGNNEEIDKNTDSVDYWPPDWEDDING